MNLSTYTKFITALVGAGVTIAAVFGLDVDPGISASVGTLLTAVGVWFFPNT